MTAPLGRLAADKSLLKRSGMEVPYGEFGLCLMRLALGLIELHVLTSVTKAFMIEWDVLNLYHMKVKILCMFVGL